MSDFINLISHKPLGIISLRIYYVLITPVFFFFILFCSGSPICLLFLSPRSPLPLPPLVVVNARHYPQDIHLTSAEKRKTARERERENSLVPFSSIFIIFGPS